jgi:hypothetical protein
VRANRAYPKQAIRPGVGARCRVPAQPIMPALGVVRASPCLLRVLPLQTSTQKVGLEFFFAHAE